MKSRFVGWRPKLILVAASTLVGLLASEFIVRFCGTAPHVKPLWVSQANSVYQRSANPLLSVELKPDFRDDDPDFVSTYEFTNAFGLRDRERSKSKTEGVRRILFLGDSVVEGHGLPQSQTISHHWEALYSNRTTEVLNFGVSGYVTRSELELLQHKGMQFEPDVVVLLFVENDFNNFIIESMPLDHQSERPKWSKHLFIHSHVFRLLAIRTNLHGFGSDADPMGWNRRAFGNNNVAEGIALFRELAVEHEFEPLIAIWPKFENSRILDMHPMPDGSGDLVIERLARMHHIPTMRMSRAFEKDRERSGVTNPRLVYTIGDNLHPSPTGSAIAATALKGFVEQRLRQLEANPGGDRWPQRVTPDKAAVAAAAALGTAQPSYATMYVNQGVALAREGKYEDALEKLTAAIAEDPEWEGGYSNRGTTYLRLGRFQEAVTDLTRAIELKADLAPPRYFRGMAYFHLHRYAEALADFNVAVELKPDDARAYYRRGILHRQQNSFDDALVDFDRAVELKPSDAMSHFQRGNTYAQLGKREKAIAGYNQSIDLDPDLAEVYHNRGTILAQLAKLDKALADFSRALELNPDYVSAYLNRSNVYLHFQQYRPALEDLTRLTQLTPQDPRPHNARAWLLATCADPLIRDGQQALVSAKRAHELSGGNHITLSTLAAAYAEIGQFAQAASSQAQALQDAPAGARVELEARLRLYQENKPYRQGEPR